MHILVKQAVLHVGRVYLCIVGANLWNSSFLQQHDLDEEDDDDLSRHLCGHA